MNQETLEGDDGNWSPECDEWGIMGDGVRKTKREEVWSDDE